MTSERSIWSAFAPGSPASHQLRTHGVHVWRLGLDRSIEDFLVLLETDGVVRANRFHFDKHRNHFVVARGFLRLLGRHLQAHPTRLKFSYGCWMVVSREPVALQHVALE